MGDMPQFGLFEAVHIDHHVVLQPSAKGHKYVLLCTDNCSGYTEMIATKTTSAVETAHKLHKRYFLRYGYVPVVISDRAQSFLGQFTQTLFELCGVRHFKTSSWHPAPNSEVELRNKILTTGLRAFLTTGQTDWASILKSVQFSYSVTHMPNVGLSPYNIVFNRQPRLPIDLAVLVNKTQTDDTPGFAETMLPSFEVLHKALAENIFENRLQAKHYHDLKAQAPNIKPGDTVFRLDIAHHSGAGAKLRDRYVGPFKVLYLVGQNAVRLQNILTGEEISPLVNINQLKTARDRRDIFNKYWTGRDQPGVLTEPDPSAVNVDHTTAADVAGPLPPSTGATPAIVGDVQTSGNGNIDGPMTSSDSTVADASTADSTARPTAHADEAHTNLQTSDAKNTPPVIAPPPTECSTTMTTRIYPVRRIIRRQRVKNTWKYKVELDPSGEETWLSAASLPFRVLAEFKAALTRKQQHRRLHQRRHADQR
jgi:hypothetical protein